FRLGQVADLGVRRHARGLADELGTGTADAVDALQPDPDVLLGRQVDTCNTRHARISNWLVDREGRPRLSEHEIVTGSRVLWKPEDALERPPARHGECAHAPATEPGWPGVSPLPRALLWCAAGPDPPPRGTAAGVA